MSNIPVKDAAKFFGWRAPEERIPPYARSILDLWEMLEDNWTDDGILDFSLEIIMKRFGEEDKNYSSFVNKQKLEVNKINRNRWYPGYYVDVISSTRDWNFGYQRYPRHDDGEDIYKEKLDKKRPFFRKGDSIIVAGQEVEMSEEMEEAMRKK